MLSYNAEKNPLQPTKLIYAAEAEAYLWLVP